MSFMLSVGSMNVDIPRDILNISKKISKVTISWVKNKTLYLVFISPESHGFDLTH